MNNVDRAKQFLPFDALKGLREELDSREEKMSRVPKRILSEELSEEISEVLRQVDRGAQIQTTFYRGGHYYSLRGTVSNIDTVYKYLLIGEEKIFFDDIYALSLLN